MKKYLFVVFCALFLVVLTGCGKKADITCTGEMEEGGIKAKATYYAYLTDNKVSRVDVEMSFDDDATAKTTCQTMELVKTMAGDEAKDMVVKCSGKTVTIENFPAEDEEDMIGVSKEEFIKAAEQQSLTCK